MKRRILSLAAALVLSAMALPAADRVLSTCEECAAYCANIPQETAACMEACCGSASPVG